MALVGMNAYTGRAVTGVEWLRQAVSRALTTPLGSRLMRRSQNVADGTGSVIFELLDQPDNAVTSILLYAATADVLAAQVPQLQLSRVQLSRPTPGRVVVDIDGTQAETGEAVSLSVDLSKFMSGATA